MGRQGTGDGRPTVDFQSSTVSKPKRRKGSRGDVDSVEEMKATGHWFSSIACARRRAIDGDARRGSAGQDGGSSGDQGGRRLPPGGLAWAEMGQKTQPVMVENARKLKRAKRKERAKNKTG
jgi:hypothetical protein